MTGSESFWVKAWIDFFGLPLDLPGWFFNLVALISTYCFVVIPSGGLLSYLDRKLTADLQARVGPKRTGPAGIFQPIADFLKLLQKESRVQWSWSENIWLSVHTMALYSTLAVMPLGSTALLVDTEMSAFLPFWAALVLALGTMLLGLSQATVPGWFGGIRVAAQTLAGSFPAFVAFLCAGVRAGSFRWSILAGSQGFSPWGWTALSNPFQFVACLVFIVSGLVLLAIPPLDGGLSMSDIHGGVGSHLYGRRLSLYRFGRFYVFFLWCVITVVLFFGAWVLPGELSNQLIQQSASKTLALVELVWLLLKTYFLMLLIVWIARANPRSRVDQITDFSWRVLSPFSLISLVGAGIWSAWRAL